jgi:16S rRNA processing protein RimM
VDYNANILLGKILRIQGYEGTLIIRLEKDHIDNIPEMEWVFPEIEGIPVPFFISSSEYSGGDILKLRFEGFETIEKVNGFAGSLVFLSSPERKNIRTDKREGITGFKVILSDKSIIGHIKDIIHNPGQDLLKIISPLQKEILVPFHKDFILGIDKKRKILTVELPEGLTEIN